MFTGTRLHTDSVMHLDLLVGGAVQMPHLLLQLTCVDMTYAFSALTLLVGHQEEHPARKN